MTRIYLVIVAIFCLNLFPTYMSSSNKSQLLSDGKSWLCIQEETLIGENKEVIDTTYYEISVCGDTLVNGFLCKRLLCSYVEDKAIDRYFIAYEKDGQVFDYDEDLNKFLLLMDFNARKGDRLTVYDETGDVIDDSWIEIEKEDSVIVNGEQRLRLTFDGGCWVEGIGSYTDSWLTYYPKPTCGCVSIHVVACYENGQCVFTQDDFFENQSGSVYSIELEDNVKVEYYDLQGVRVPNPQNGHLYIVKRDNFVVKELFR